MLTKNRIGNALAVAAAVVGLVLVFTGAGHGDDKDDAPAAPPASSEVVPAPAVPGQVQAPAQTQAPGGAQTQAPAAPPTKDDDGDDDG